MKTFNELLKSIKKPLVIVLGEKTHGGGKSFIAKKICELLTSLGFSCYLISAGSELRKMAIEKNMSIEEFVSKLTHDTKLARKIDIELDKKIIRNILQVYKEGKYDFIIVDSLLAPYYIKKLPVRSLSILLLTDPDIAAERVFKRFREGDKKYTSVEDAKECLLRRTREDAERFDQLAQLVGDPLLREAYKIASQHFGSERYFDIVLDNNKYYTEVLEEFKKKLLEFYSSKP